MQKRIVVLSTLIILILSNIVVAQESWTLEQCIKHAFDNNIQIKQQELSVKLNEGGYLKSKLNVLPTLNGSAYHSYTYGRAVNDQNSIAEDMSNTSLSLNSTLTLFDGLQKLNTIKQGHFDLLASVSDVDKIKNNIALSIASAFLQILYNQEILASANRQVELSKLQVGRTTVLVKAGSLPEGNLLEIEALLATDELQQVNAQNQLELSILNLTQLIEIKKPEGFSIQKPNIEGLIDKIVALTPTDVYQSALATMPQIIGANHRVSSAEKGLNIAKSGMIPTLTFTTSYSTRAQKMIDYYYDPDLSNGIVERVLWKDPSYGDQFKDKASFSFGFNLSVPIFNGWMVQNGITNAKISLDRNRLSLDNEKNVLFKDIQQSYTDATAAQKKLKASQKNLTALEEAYRYADQKFNLGLTNSYDYTNAKNKLSKAEADLIQAKYELIFKSKILEFYKGVPLSL